MKVLSFLNEKGGVGKTTLSRHFAAGAALHDLRVLLIDTDTQGHCSRLLGIGKQPGLYRLLMQRAPWGKVLYEANAAHWSGREPTIGQLLVLPSDISTRDITPEQPLALRERLAELDGAIDLVILDTSPTPVKLQNVLMLASDYVAYPTQCQDLSLDGMKETTLHMHNLNAERAGFGLEPLKLVGVMPTMYSRTLVHGEALDALLNHYKRLAVWEPVPHRTVWQECEWVQQTLFSYAPHADATEMMRRMVDRLLKTLQIPGFTKQAQETPHATEI
jgi:chromosome partitioning protein